MTIANQMPGRTSSAYSRSNAADRGIDRSPQIYLAAIGRSRHWGLGPQNTPAVTEPHAGTPDGAILTNLQRAFDSLAPRWDAEHGPMSPNALGFRSCVAQLRSVCRTCESRRVIDIGCGTGQHILHLSDLISTGVGIDLSPGMIERAKGNALSWQFGERIRFENTAAENLLSHRLGTFDLVMFIGSLEHMRHQGAALDIAKQLLTPNGRIVVIMRYPDARSVPESRRRNQYRGAPPTRHLAPDLLQRVAAHAGLQPLCFRGLPFGPSGRPPMTHVPR